MHRYATVFEALNDGEPPNDNIEKGDKILELGKDEEHQLTYIGEDGEIKSVNFEMVDQYDHGEQASETEILEAAKDWWFDEKEYSA